MGKSSQSPAVIKFIPVAILLGGLGWTAVIWLFLSTVPYAAGIRWLFFLCWFLAVTGTALPAVAFLNRRFPGRIPATQTVIIRQASWLGIYAASIAWLQIGRLTSAAIFLLLAIALITIETFFRLRERGQWRP